MAVAHELSGDNMRRSGSNVARTRSASALTVAALLLTAIYAFSPQHAAYAETASIITGKVALSAEAPSEWTENIRVRASDGAFSSEASLSPDGTYQITGLPAGDYRVQFSASSYWDSETQTSVQTNLVSEYYDDTTDYSKATLITLAEGATKTNIDATLATGGTISGEVTLPPEAPAEWFAGVRVNANTTSNSYGYGSTTVSPDGTYQITGLPAGDYRVQFSASSYWDSETQASVQTNLVSEYYDDTTDYSKATLITLAEGATKTNIDATLTGGRSISGRVTLPDGADVDWLRGVSVSASGTKGGFGSAGRVDPHSGEFTISGLAPESYIVQFSVSTIQDGAQSVTPNLVPEYYASASTRETSTPVDVRASDASGIDATLEIGTSVAGTIAIPRDAPREWLKGVRISAIGADGLHVGNGVQPDPATGAYVIGQLPAGEYRLQFSAGWFWDGAETIPTNLASEYYDDATELSRATPVSTLTGNLDGIDADLGYGSRLQGEIDISALQDEAIGTLPGYGIYLMSLDGVTSYSGFGGDFSGDVETFDFSNLAPGSYRIAVTSSTWNEESETLTPWSAQYLREGTSSIFTLTPGQEQTGLRLTAHAVDATISGSLTAEGFEPSPVDGILGSALIYEQIDGDWVRLPGEGRFDTNQNGVLPFELDVPAGNYTVGYESDYSTIGTDIRERWWNDKPTLATATAIALKSGDDHQNTNGAIAPASDSPAEPDPPVTFTDVAGHTFEREVSWLAGKGITRGWEVKPGEYEFRPNAYILRGEMATFLYRLAGKPSFTPPATSPFIDVSSDFVFYKEIAWLASTGISRGWDTPAGIEFRPFATTSRDVMAAFLHRFEAAPTYAPSASPFSDVNESTVFAREILWLASEGISTGWDIGHGCREYRPYQNVTRSEMAAFIYRSEIGGTSPVTGNTCSPPREPLISGTVSSGAFCAKAFAEWYGYTAGGVLMRCSTSPADPRLRWRAA